MPSDPLKAFLLRVLLWLPVTFAAWYYMAAALIWPVGVLADWIIDGLLPGALERVTVQANHLVFLTHLEVTAPDGRVGEAVVEINPLIYTFNLPLVAALTVAVGAAAFTLGKLVVIYLGLLPAHLWGVCFEFLMRVLLRSGPEVAGQVEIGSFGREVVALGYQFGFLMLPTISAAALWIAMNRQFLDELYGTQR